MEASVRERVTVVEAGIVRACESSHRLRSEVALVGVTKNRPDAKVADLIAAGIFDIGENRVQEAAIKKSEVIRLIAEKGIKAASVKWHMIGRLQSNKAGKAAELFDVIHSVTSEELAGRLDVAAGGLGRVLDCYVQVNASGETSKAGVSMDEAEGIAAKIVSCGSLKLVGLMTIGPLTENQSLVEKAFLDLRDQRDELQQKFPEWGKLGLSMGMSGDYPLAIKCGSTIVRIGTAFFGQR